MGTKLNIFTGQLDFTGTGSTPPPTPETPYADTFNNTTDWVGPSGGFYTITIAQVTHQKGINPQVQVLELDGSNFNIVDVDRVQVTPTGDVEIRVPASPDLRFNGKIIIGV